MKRLFYFVLWLLNILLFLYGVIAMSIDLVSNAELRWALLFAFALMGVFVALILWPVSRGWAQAYPMAFYLLGGVLMLAGAVGMVWMMVLPASYTTLQVMGGWLVLMGGLMIFGMPWLLKKESQTT